MEESKRYALYVGAFQEWHAGHEWLINQKLMQDVPILIGILPNAEGELSPLEVRHEIHRKTKHDPRIRTMVMPVDIESINYLSRPAGLEEWKLGYRMISWRPPPEVARFWDAQEPPVP